MYAQLGNSKPFIITDRGDLKTLKLKKLSLEVDPKTGMSVFSSFDSTGKETVHFMAIEVIRHFGRFGRIRVDSLEPEDIVFKDGNKLNNTVANLGISEKAAERLNLIGATGEHADKGTMPPAGVMADDIDDEELEESASSTLEKIEAITVADEVVSEDVSDPTQGEIFSVVEPESGSYYDIVNSLGVSILDKKLNGKSKVLNYLKENSIEVENKQVLL